MRRFSLCLTLLLCVLSARVDAAIIAGTSMTTPLPFNPFHTFAMIVNSNTNAWAGVAFTTPGDSDYTLDSIVLPLAGVFTDSVTFRLYDDANGQPGDVLETVTISGFPAAPDYALVTGIFSGLTELEANKTYYMVGYLPVAGYAQIDWAGSSPATSVRMVYGTAESGGGWNSAIFSSGPAFQINGTKAAAAVPAPPILALMAGCTALLFAARRRR